MATATTVTRRDLLETLAKAGAAVLLAGTVHRVSANASATKPCRFLAMVFVDKTKSLTEPV
jgi:hypothetical protein